jgi:hypothetical protein
MMPVLIPAPPRDGTFSFSPTHAVRFFAPFPLHPTGGNASPDYGDDRPLCKINRCPIAKSNNNECVVILQDRRRKNMIFRRLAPSSAAHTLRVFRNACVCRNPPRTTVHRTGCLHPTFRRAENPGREMPSYNRKRNFSRVFMPISGAIE